MRIRLDADGAFGSNGGFDHFGFGADVRFACPGAVAVGLIGCGATPPTSTVGGGTRLFVRARLLQAPDFRLDVEGSYKTVPTLDDIDSSGFGIGLRATL